MIAFIFLSDEVDDLFGSIDQNLDTTSYQVGGYHEEVAGRPLSVEPNDDIEPVKYNDL